MKKVLKWFGIFIASLLVLIIFVVAGLSVSTNIRLNKTYTITPTMVAITENSEAIERGAYLYDSMCAGCHGEKLEGTRFFDDPVIGYFPASNLTSGQEGVGSYYSDLDFVRAIRHGISPDGKPLIIMPSGAFWHFSDEDLGSIIAYLKSAPAMDSNLGEKKTTLIGTALVAAGAFGNIINAETIPHEQQPPAVPPRAVTAEYGEYLANLQHCALCHGANLNGAQSPEPGAPFSPNLTPGGVLATWSTSDFINLMRTGTTPLGRQLDKNFMPYEDYGRMSDDDLSAIFQYLQSLPELATPLK